MISTIIVSEKRFVSAETISSRKKVGNDSIASTKRIIKLSTIPPAAPEIAP